LPPPPTLYEQREILREHYRLTEQLYGAQQSGTLMRKFGIKYAALHPCFEQVRETFTRVRNRDDWSQVLSTWYDKDRPGRYPDPAIHRVNGECS
jgi:hypothetical protein